MRRALFAAAPLILSACYSYVPAPAPAPDPGARVRVELTDHGTAELAPLVGPGVTAVEGRFVGTQADSLRVGVTTVRSHRTGEQYWQGEPVVIPRAAVARVEQRRFSPVRSALLAVSIAAGAVLIAEGLDLGDSLFGGKSDKTGAGQ